ncbi:MAG: DeoR/GlpR transcriptional regulator [Alkalibacterium sp.]|nr:DeoR/GlpR transcriptional regulator [Alkalibacterium sp.]TVP92870.1 MAG: DeoR/GlpR transcriptional regulator [Alkalibacterium sp.]
MLTQDRYTFILNQLEQKDTVTIQSLIEELNHSESTIRRDLTTLEEQNKLVRIHGGAKRKRKAMNEASMDDKTVKNTHEKEQIAKTAAALVDDHDVIYLDAGTTTYAMIPLLEHKNITVVTNGVPHAELLTDYRVDTILLGGKIKQKTKAIIGTVAEQQLSSMHFTKAFMGMNGVDPHYGLTTPDIEEASVKKKAIEQSNESYVLADHSKLGEVSFIKVADIDDCAIITSESTVLTKKIAELTKVIEVNK